MLGISQILIIYTGKVDTPTGITGSILLHEIREKGLISICAVSASAYRVVGEILFRMLLRLIYLLRMRGRLYKPKERGLCGSELVGGWRGIESIYHRVRSSTISG